MLEVNIPVNYHMLQIFMYVGLQNCYGVLLNCVRSQAFQINMEIKW